MGDKSGIEWTDATWTPVVGCSVISPGCTNCYAMKMAARLEAMGGKAGAKYAGLTTRTKAGPVWNGTVRLDETALDQPLRWKRPRRIFVNSMSDLFHEDLPFAEVARVFEVIYDSICRGQQHTFQILTKRPDRMAEYFEWAKSDPFEATHILPANWPRVWFGVSAEDQRRADERIPFLLNLPVRHRWVSAEPLLGPVDIIPYVGGRAYKCQCENAWHRTEINRLFLTGNRATCAECGTDAAIFPTLDWVVVGGESGPDARPMHPDWARALRDQCVETETPFLFKQWGAWQTVYDRDRDDPDWRRCPKARNNNERYVNLTGGHGFHGERVVFARRVSKKAAGHVLDGRTWEQYPEESTYA